MNTPQRYSVEWRPEEPTARIEILHDLERKTRSKKEKAEYRAERRRLQQTEETEAGRKLYMKDY